VELVTVPAVGGRLLRFEGSSLHAVPRPADLWFLSFVMGAPEYTPEEIWGRSVILFNTWMVDPPKDVPFDQVPADGENVSENEVIVNKRDEWSDVFALLDAKNVDDNVCDDIDDQEEDTATSKVKIWLLGNERRRDCQLRTVNLKAKSAVKDAFLEPHLVSHLTLEQ